MVVQFVLREVDEVYHDVVITFSIPQPPHLVCFSFRKLPAPNENPNLHVRFVYSLSSQFQQIQDVSRYSPRSHHQYPQLLPFNCSRVQSQ